MIVDGIKQLDKGCVRLLMAVLNPVEAKIRVDYALQARTSSI
jgi:hypothetical protein